jgi:RNA polymerase sigma factor (TIGR02999 family)
MDPKQPLPDALVAEAYEHLKALASKMRRRAGDAIHPTSLVHDVYERLARSGTLEVTDREHLIAVGVRAMRYVLADRARRHMADKRSGGWARMSLAGVGQEPAIVDIVALDDALRALSALDEHAGQVAELRLLGGLNEVEIAQVLGTSDRTVRRRWRAARAWLQVRLAG